MERVTKGASKEGHTNLCCISRPLAQLCEQVKLICFTRMCDTVENQESMMGTRAADPTRILDSAHQGLGADGSIGRVSDRMTR